MGAGDGQDRGTPVRGIYSESHVLYCQPDFSPPPFAIKVPSKKNSVKVEVRIVRKL